MRAKGSLNEGSAMYECCRVLSNFSGLNVTAKGDNECKKKSIYLHIYSTFIKTLKHLQQEHT